MRGAVARTIALVAACLAVGGCRQGVLCARMLTAECSCSLPVAPFHATCLAQVDVQGCDVDFKPDPCQLQPCCESVPLDGGASPVDAPGDLPPAPDGEAADLFAGSGG
jgi:hypothetical protein